ncbi:MAG: PQQ-binding-like beta-propeller repeat protein [Planctomycetota bacterium]
MLFAVAWPFSAFAEDAQPSERLVFPAVRFVSPDQAELCWESDQTGGRWLVEYRKSSQQTVRTIQSRASGALQSVTLKDLEPGELYEYRFTLTMEGKRRSSAWFECDNRMNYSTPEIDAPTTSPAEFDAVLERLQHLGGFAVVHETLANQWAMSIAGRTTMSVVSVCGDDESLLRRRRRWHEHDGYGIRLMAQRDVDLPDEYANLVITSTANADSSLKWLSPIGCLVCVGDRPSPMKNLSFESLSPQIHLATRSDRQKLTRWDHQYGTAANQSFSGETLNDVDTTDQLEIRWLGRPGADFGIDRNPRMPAPLAVGGRLFHQGMNRMIALDAFNGTVLWSLEVPQLRRVNIPRDCANWCADEDFVYVAIKDRVWVIDATSGEWVRSMLLPEVDVLASGDDEVDVKPMDWGYVANTSEVLLGTAVKRGSQYEEFWAKPSWYDGKDDQATAKVCGNAIIAYDKKYGDVRWKRDVDAVIHSTITIADDRVIFVEVKASDAKGFAEGKLTNQQIAGHASVVCLDLKTGEELWNQKAPTFHPKQIVAFGMADNHQFVLETSSDAKFHFTSLDLTTGESRWTKSAKWPEDHHGAHMQHAVLMNGKIYVQPQILDAETGEILQTNTLGKRRGCATPVGTGNTIIYRGGGGPLSLWSLERDDRTEFSRLRPSCWLSTIPAQGMLFSPEAGGGCSCGGWMECSIGFAPQQESKQDAR